MPKLEYLKKVAVTSAAQLRTWLEGHHAQEESVWLVTWRRHVEAKYVSREEVLDELVSFGWTDGARRKLDDERTMQLISPRRAAHWAKSYKDRAARLIEDGRMAAPGLASIEEAKRSGAWNLMDDVDALIVPDDLEAALESIPSGADRFAALAPSYRRNVLRWIKLAKTPETRGKRIAKLADATAEGRRIPQM